ncbi:MAG: hypothetical protein Ct9H300mP8_08130 [Gammaproteobacteria bacterium]|nr:MAG: hypothetical protein Ct9H300mP8_08130 [Gammaproteobacteria bacterium]
MRLRVRSNSLEEARAMYKYATSTEALRELSHLDRRIRQSNL